MAAEDGYGTYTVPRTVEVRAYDSGIAAGKRAVKLTTLDNLIERNADVLKFSQSGMLQRLHLRYLDFRMRQLVWKAVLFSPDALRQYEENMTGLSAAMFKAAPDEPLLLSMIARVIEQTQWTGDLTRALARMDNLHYLSSGNSVVELILRVFVYVRAVIGNTGIQKDIMISLFIPLVRVFHNYQLEYRQGYHASMYFGILRELHGPIVQRRYKDEENFTLVCNGVVRTFLDGLKNLDEDLELYFRKFLLGENIVSTDSFQKLTDRLTPEHEEEFADPRIERRFRNLYEDVSNGLNPHFYSPLSDEVLNSFDSMKRHYLLFEFLKTFIERLGCSFMHADCVNIVWDALLTKPTREENDMHLVWSLSAIVACLKDKGFLPRRDSVSQKLIDDNYCGSIVDFIALIEAKGPTVHEVDFFRTYRKLFTKADTSV